jgi:hypothetical protein
MGIQEKLSKMLKEAEAKSKSDQVDLIMAYEQGDLSDEETLGLFSDLIKSGLVWNLQGHYGRTAKALIDNGYITKEGKILKTECIKESLTKNRKRDYEEYLNDFPVPDHDAKSAGGRIPDNAKYGTWLRKNDPIAFNVGYSDWIRENRKVKNENIKLKRVNKNKVKLFESVQPDDDIERISSIVKDNKFLGLRPHLIKAGYTNVNFIDSDSLPSPMWNIKTKSGKPIVVINKKYADASPTDTVVGDYVIGYM